MERLADHHHGNCSICRCFLVKFFIQSELFLEGVNFCFLTRVKIYSIKHILKVFKDISPFSNSARYIKAVPGSCMYFSLKRMDANTTKKWNNGVVDYTWGKLPH